MSRTAPEAAFADAPPKRVYLHIGAPKTGTTYLQHVLHQNLDQLAEDGVLFPYPSLTESFRSAHDFCGETWFGRGPDYFHGSWEAVARRTREWTGHTVIISNELLAGARLDRVETGLAALGEAELHVVFSARDLARQLVSDWQEQIKHTHTVTLETFVSDLIELGIDAPAPFGRMFWGLHDAVEVLATWSHVVPAERIHLVTLPPPGGEPHALWRRFCATTGLVPGNYDTEVARSNKSMGLVETEFVRRLNERMGRLPGGAYDSIVRLYLAEEILVGGTRRLSLPPQHWPWVIDRSKTMVRELTAAGYAVEGDLADLIPVEPLDEAARSTTVADEELSPVGMEASVALLQRAAQLLATTHRLRADAQGVPPPRRSAAERVREQLRRWPRAHRAAVGLRSVVRRVRSR